VGLLAGHQELGGTGMGVECVGGDHHAVKVEVGQQRPEAGDLFGRAADLLLGQHRAAGVVHRRQQVHRAAIAIGWGSVAGATQGLAVDRHRPLPWPPPLGMASAVAAVMALAVGEPGADRGGQGVGVQPAERAADGGLGRHRPVVGGVAPGAKRGTDRLGRVGGPLGNGGKRAGAGQHRGGRQGQDGDQRMAAAQGTPAGRGWWPGRRAGARARLPGGGWHRQAGPGPAGSGMMGRQARASTAIMRRWEPNDPGGSCLLHTIGRYRVLPHNRTDRQIAGALGRQVRRAGIRSGGLTLT
jgi:hypothetical protein